MSGLQARPGAGLLFGRGVALGVILSEEQVREPIPLEAAGTGRRLRFAPSFAVSYRAAWQG